MSGEIIDPEVLFEMVMADFLNPRDEQPDLLAHCSTPLLDLSQPRISECSNGTAWLVDDRVCRHGYDRFSPACAGNGY